MRYTTSEVAALTQWPAARVHALVRAGLLAPEREGRSYRFGFRDLVLVRTAKSLSEQGVAFASLRRALTALRLRLPAGRPLSALRLSTHGNRVLVDEEGVLYEPDSGQTHLRFEHGPEPQRSVPAATGMVCPAPAAEVEDAEALYAEALEHEESGEIGAAIRAYRACLNLQPTLGAAQLNLGRLLQAAGEPSAAAACYGAALADAETRGLAHFNLGTLHEERNDCSAAIRDYQRAADSGIVDAHYNLARLHEQRGERDAALRHLLRFTRSARADA